MSANVDPKNVHEISSRKHAKPLTCCRISPSGSHVFAGAEDLNVYRWSMTASDEPAIVFSGHESWVRCFDFSADGKTLYTAGWDGQLGWWDAEATPPVKPVEQPAVDSSVESSDKGKPAKAASADAQPQAEFEPVAPTRMIQAHRGFARWVRVSPCGRMLATCGNDLLVKVWDEATGELLAELPGHQRHPYAVEFHPTENQLVSEDLMGQVYRWDLEKREQDGVIDAKIMTGYDNKFAADMGGARDMKFNEDGTVLACAGITNVVNAFAGVQDPLTILIDWNSQTITHHLRQEKKATGVAWGIRRHPDGFWIGAIAHQSGKGELAFWRIEEPDGSPNASAPQDKSEAGTAADAKSTSAPAAKSAEATGPPDVSPFHTLTLPKGARGLDLAPDHRQLSIAHSDGILRIYEMSAAKEAKPKTE